MSVCCSPAFAKPGAYSFCIVECFVYVVIKDRCVFIVFKMGESTIAIKSKLKRCQCIVHKQSRPRLYRLADMVWMARHRNWFQYFVSFVWFFSDHKANYARLVRAFPQPSQDGGFEVDVSDSPVPSNRARSRSFTTHYQAGDIYMAKLFRAATGLKLARPLTTFVISRLL